MFLFACVADKAGCQVDSVMGIIRSLPQDTVRLHELEKWMRITMDTPDELVILDTLLFEATRLKNIEYQAMAYRNKVRHYYNADNLEKARVEAEPAIAFFRKHKIYPRLFDVEGMLITLYTNRQEYEFSLQKGNEMYKEAETLNNIEGKASACYVLAYACYASGRTREALEWNQKGIALVHDRGDRQSLMELYFLQVECALNLSKPDDLKSYLDSVQMLLIAEEEGESDNMTREYSYYWLWLNCRYAYYFLNNNDLNRAEIYLKEASKHIDERSYDIYQDLLHFTWSDYYLALGEYDKALEELEKGYVFVQKYAGEEAEVLQKKARIDYQKGDYLLAADEIRRSIQISDSLNNIRFIDQSQQLRTIYDVNRLETEAKERTFVVRVQTAITLFLCGSVFALCIFFLRFYKMRRQLAFAAKNAQISDQNTSLFLNNMGREVKDFLEEMSGLSDQLIETKEEEKRQEYATTICTRNEQAQKVIFDILDFSKIESGRMQFHFENIDLPEYVSMVLFNLREYIPKNVEVYLDSSDSILFVTDSFRLNQILTSLLRYAVTHTKPGALHFSYEVKEQGILFRISGTEWRMSPDEYDCLFDRILQSVGRLEDMNLGMIISKGLIQALGGTLMVYPEPEGGTRFEFAIPKQSLPENG